LYCRLQSSGASLEVVGEGDQVRDGLLVEYRASDTPGALRHLAKAGGGLSAGRGGSLPRGITCSMRLLPGLTVV
jgi:hypothetical protein